MVQPLSESMKQAHLCVLQHLVDVDPYLKRHVAQLEQDNPRVGEREIMRMHNLSFVEWFNKAITDEMSIPDNNVSDTIKWLSRGPRSHYVQSFEGYDINGYTFYTRRQDDKSVVQNSGVTVVVSSREYASGKDQRPVDATQTYCECIICAFGS